MDADTQRLTELVRAACQGMGPFRPFALYDPQLDRVIVQTRDCSICEVRVNDVLTMYEANHPVEGKDKYCGFEIACMRYFQRQYGLQGSVLISELLDCALFGRPESLNWLQIARGLAAELSERTVELTRTAE